MMVDSPCLLPYCLFLCTPSPLCLSQEISLSSVSVEQTRASVPAGDSNEISTRSFSGHRMKGGMSGAGDIVNVCVFAFLCALNTVCVGGNVFMSHPLR